MIAAAVAVGEALSIRASPTRPQINMIATRGWLSPTTIQTKE